jgi:hypothetical protein
VKVLFGGSVAKGTHLFKKSDLDIVLALFGFLQQLYDQYRAQVRKSIEENLGSQQVRFIDKPGARTLVVTVSAIGIFGTEDVAKDGFLRLGFIDIDVVSADASAIYIPMENRHLLTLPQVTGLTLEQTEHVRKQPELCKAVIRIIKEWNHSRKDMMGEDWLVEKTSKLSGYAIELITIEIWNHCDFGSQSDDSQKLAHVFQKFLLTVQNWSSVKVSSQRVGDG